MKKKLLIFLSLLFFTPFIVKAYEVNSDWQNSWGGNDADRFSEVLQTKDGGFVVIGCSDSTDIEGLPNKGNYDAIIVKYDKDGNMVWQKNWGGSYHDGFSSAILTEDGGIIVIGESRSTDIEGIENKGYVDAIIVKYDKDGNMKWQKNWGGSKYDEFSSAILTEDGGVVVVGYSSSTNIDGITNKGEKDAVIVKFDKDGNMKWQKNWGGSKYDEFSSAILTEDGGVVVVGYSSSTNIDGITNKGEEDAVIVKFDKDGNMLWQKSWGGNGYDYLTSFLLTEDGGIIVIGESRSTDIEGIENKGYVDAIIVKYDKDGNMKWQKNWGGNSSEWFKTVVSTEDGGFAIAGVSFSTDIDGITNKGEKDAVIVKFDKDGNTIWQKSMGGNDSDWFSDVLQTKDGGLVVIYNSALYDEDGMSTIESEVIIVKYDKDGNMKWQKSWSGNGDISFDSVVSTEDDGFVVAGDSTSTDIEGIANKGAYDFIIVKISVSNELNLEEEITNGTATVEQQGSLVIVKPTPNEGYKVDQVIVKDTNGDVIEVTKLEDGTYTFELYDDVSVEVLFKEAIENPKTGDNILLSFVTLFISICGFVIFFIFFKKRDIKL